MSEQLTEQEKLELDWMDQTLLVIKRQKFVDENPEFTAFISAEPNNSEDKDE